MLWPGTLIYTAQAVPNASVAVYALLAAGGDLGGSIAPQLLGSITDAVSQSEWAASLTENLSSEQIGFKAGMLIAALFPLIGTAVVLVLKRAVKKEKRQCDT